MTRSMVKEALYRATCLYRRSPLIVVFLDRTDVRNLPSMVARLLAIVAGLLLPGSRRRKPRKTFVARLRKWQTLAGALIGFFALAGSNVWTAYAGRHAEDVKTSRACEALTRVVLSELDAVTDVMEANRLGFQRPSSDTLGTPAFVLPPLDDLLGARETDIGLLDGDVIGDVERTRLLFHSLRQVFSSTQGIGQIGDVYIQTPRESPAELRLVELLQRDADIARYRLRVSTHCRKLRDTSIF